MFARRLIGSAPSRIRWLKFPKIGDPNIVPEIVGSPISGFKGVLREF